MRRNGTERVRAEALGRALGTAERPCRRRWHPTQLQNDGQLARIRAQV
ncbi:hypothetical protein [Mangrovicella endophytica]|nr:hypothetical protein [Mangrovicella endophytica]